MTSSPALAQPQSTGLVRLRIVSTTDLHAHLIGYNYTQDVPQPGTGLVQASATIETARAEAANCLLVDNGDLIQGSPLGDVFAQPLPARGSNDVHPMIAAMNALRYDAANLGNHDFEFGFPALQSAFLGADFPVLASNMVQRDREAAGPPHPFQRRALLDRIVVDHSGKEHSLKIGLLGLLPPEVMPGVQHALGSDLALRDSVAAAREGAALLRDEGADLIVLLVHVGINLGRLAGNSTSLAQKLSRVPGIDALILGHTHEVFPSIEDNTNPDDGINPETGQVYGVAAVQAGSLGTHIGLIDLDLERDDTGWFVRASRSEVRSNGHDPHETISRGAEVLSKLSEPYHTATLTKMRQTVGAVLHPLHSYFSLISNSATERLVGLVLRQHAQTLVASGRFADLPILAAVSPKKIGGLGGAAFFADVPAGPLLERHVFDLYPFPNHFAALPLTGMQLRDWLEKAAEVFNTITEGGAGQNLLHPTIPGYQFESLHGLTYEIDVSQPIGNRISDIRHMGRAVAPEDKFMVAMPNFRAFGGGGFVGPNRDELIHEPQTSLRSLLRQQLRQGFDASAGTERTWRFKPLANTPVLFETGPGARAYLNDPATPPLKDLGDAPSGFARFEFLL
jgi:2',3'-cyclic-nucleotide 2'-phosphodiesterase/3'-nucleotidase